jgi:hypothetical protein
MCREQVAPPCVPAQRWAIGDSDGPEGDPYMLEAMIEKWSNRDGSVDYLWSLWRNGKRVTMGGHFASAAAAEQAARRHCQEKLGCEPDRVTLV